MFLNEYNIAYHDYLKADQSYNSAFVKSLGSG